MKFCVALVTTPGPGVSRKLAMGLLRNKMAACVNRVPGIESRYWWKGKIETAREELLVIKTSKGKLPSLIRWVRENHPYTVCEVIALPVAQGNPAYLRWIEENTKNKF